MTTLQERMANDLAELDDNFTAEEDDSFSSEASEEVEIAVPDEEADEAEAAAAAALRDQLLQAAGRQPAASKRSRKGAGPNRTNNKPVKKEETPIPTAVSEDEKEITEQAAKIIQESESAKSVDDTEKEKSSQIFRRSIYVV